MTDKTVERQLRDLADIGHDPDAAEVLEVVRAAVADARREAVAEIAEDVGNRLAFYEREVKRMSEDADTEGADRD